MSTRFEAPRWPARLDLLQSGTGLALGLFMWVHMLFVSSILLGKDAMWVVARFFEGYYVFGRPLTWLVSVLVATIFALFFMASVHLYIMMTRPDRIGPFESADRVWTDLMWPLYLVMLFAVEFHGGIGLYRLALKWGWFAGPDPLATRRKLRLFKWALTAFFLILGIATLLAYIKIGIAHAPHYGEHYVPTFLQGVAP